MKAVVAALVLACLAVAYAGDGTVLVLTKQNFEETLASTPKILVEFYAPWCGHCKALAPEYDAAAQQLGEDGTLAKVDCTTEQDICSQFGVRGYPTLKFFTNGKASDYEGGRKASNIVSYVLKQSRPVVTELKSEEQVKTFTGKEEVVLVGFVDAAAEGRDVFTSLAEAHRNDFTVGIVSDAAVAKAFDVTSFPSAVLFRKFDEPQVKFTEELTEEALAAFVKSESFPVLGQLGPENYRQYIERGLPLVNIFTDPKSDADKKVVDAAREVAKTFKGKLSVVEIDGVAYQRHATSLGLSGKTPGIVIQDTNKHTKFLFDETAALTFEAATFRTFLQDFLDGKLTPFMKSAPIPEDNKGPLITIVGKTWNEIVIDNDKDVLVEFYAPWCGHCKELAPKYEQLAAQFANNKNVVIAKIDATENDAPNVEVQGFPTVYLFPKGDKTNPKQYQGDRTVEAMAKFVEINGNSFRTPGPGAASEHEL